MDKINIYEVKSARIKPELKGLWNGPAWRQAAGTLELSHFRPEGSDHRPKTLAKLLYTDRGIYCIFLVEDRYVRCVHMNYMDPVYEDSCVEFFVRPKQEAGYFNFELNCGGSLFASYIRNHERTPEGFREFTPLSENEGRQVLIHNSLPKIIEHEIVGPIVWTVEFFIPFSLLEKYAGPLADIKGKIWDANFFKCGDRTSHPHWASWVPLPTKNFHLPECFGRIRFE